MTIETILVLLFIAPLLYLAAVGATIIGLRIMRDERRNDE